MRTGGSGNFVMDDSFWSLLNPKSLRIFRRHRCFKGRGLSKHNSEREMVEKSMPLLMTVSQSTIPKLALIKLIIKSITLGHYYFATSE